MAMNDGTWARHANPWSVYTRVPVLLVLALAIWSRVWFGWWSLIAIGAVVVWIVVNPRAFPPPERLDSWASRGVLGERYWLARKFRPIPKHHERSALLLSSMAAASLLPMAWGLWVLNPWAAFGGALLSSVFKLWFVDRMAWLHDDMAGGREFS